VEALASVVCPVTSRVPMMFALLATERLVAEALFKYA
jgi:hypothetical protein